MSALRHSNYCMEAVLKFLGDDANRKMYPKGAVLGVYVKSKSAEPFVRVIPFKSDAEAIEYRNTKVPEELREGSVLLPVSGNCLLML